jgi:TolB protein
VVREDLGTDTYWRVFVRAADDQQSGQLGEPLRAMPWDFLSRNQGDVEAYNQGGRLRASVPSGYYIDFTQLAQDYGWEWVAAATDWRGNYNGTNFWAFQRRDDLSWLEAMREIYTEGQLGGFAQQQPAATPTGAVNPSTPVFLPTQITPTAAQPTAALPPPPTSDAGSGG